MGISRVRNDAVWSQLRIIFIGSGLLFLINNYFGFANALTDGEIARSQLLIHLHAASIGWITLSAIGVGIWVVTGDRDVSRGYERWVRFLGWAAVLIFAAYIPNFWLAFLPGDVAVTTFLPIFGSLAVLVLWSSAIFVISQLPRQATLTTVQLLVAGALLVASIGATVGALLGLEHAIGTFLPIKGEDRVGAHAGMMDTYLFLAGAGIIEWMVRPLSRWSWAGLAQAAAWTIGASLVPVAFFLDALGALLPVFGLLLLLGLAIFLVRIAWRALLVGPAGSGSAPWAFFGAAWLVAYMGLFMVGVGSGDFASLPAWWSVAFVHAGFVGMMTNLLLGVHAARAREASATMAWGEPVARWTINIGLLVFIGLEVAADIRLGALVMGVGVVLGVLTMLLRLWASASRESLAQPAPEGAG